MKSIKIIFILIYLLVHATYCQKSDQSPLLLLSDHIPTDVPLVFGPGIISIEGTVDASITFSPDMRELYFNRRKPGESHNIHTMMFIDGEWTQPALVSFSTDKNYLDFHSRFSPKGDRIYFGSTRPLSDNTPSTGLHQWYVDKHENGWGQPIPMEEPFLDQYIMCTSPAENGNLYFTSKNNEDNLEDEGIYYSVNHQGQYNSIQKLGNGINGLGKWKAHPYIAPDESYLIYDAERTTIYENGDLFISFNKDGTWTESYSLGPEINTELSEGAATVSPDGKYLFFSRGEEKVAEDGSTYWVADIYWIDFNILMEKIEKKIRYSVRVKQ